MITASLMKELIKVTNEGNKTTPINLFKSNLNRFLLCFVIGLRDLQLITSEMLVNSRE